MPKNFQLIVLGVFVFLAVLAVLIFSGVFSRQQAEELTTGPVVVWGTIPTSALGSVRNELGSLPFVYQEVAEDQFEQKFIEALASGEGPDLVVISESFIYEHGSKLYPITFENLPEREFRESFTDAGEVFIQGGQIYALPLLLDPIMMYWNRALFKNAGVARYPVNWVEFNTLPEKLTKKDASGAILESAVALGGSKNITHAKEILSTLVLQTGDPIVDTSGPEPQVVLGSLPGDSAASALRFYAEFANPLRSSYSWNSSLPNSRDAFAAESVAMYFGLASDYRTISRKNPHIDFDIATVPQSSSPRAVRTTFTHVYGVAIVKNSQNLAKAFEVAWFMVFRDFAEKLSEALLLPPARRDLLEKGSQDRVLSVTYDSAIIARTWLDPNPLESVTVFRTMIDGATSGEFNFSEAIATGRSLLGALFGKK